MRYFMPIVLLTMTLFFLWMGLSKDPVLIPSALINKPIPHFKTVDLFDPKKKLTEKMFTNHLSLLVVWSSWCNSCLLEHNFLLSLEKNQHLQIIGLNYRDEVNAAKSWLKKHGNPYQKVIFDSKGLLGINLGVYGVPESYLIDEKGIIRYKHIGPLTNSSWTSIIPLL